MLLAQWEDVGINNGQLSLRSRTTAFVAPVARETLVQIGAGTGYCSSMLSELVGGCGGAHAYEIEPKPVEIRLALPIDVRATSDWSKVRWGV